MKSSKLKCSWFVFTVSVSLPRVRIQEIMTVVNFTHVLFLTYTQKSRYICHASQYLFTECTVHPSEPTPCIDNKTTLLCLLGEQASLLVVTNTYPPMSLVYQQLPHPLAFLPLSPFHTPQFKLHYLQRRHQQSRSSLSGTVKTYYYYSNYLFVFID
jgi:hypothetical protein